MFTNTWWSCTSSTWTKSDSRNIDWTDTVRAKRRFYFHPTVHINTAVLISPVAFHKTFITDEHFENVVNFTKQNAEILVNYPDVQARAALKEMECGYILGISRSWMLYESQNAICIRLGNMPLLCQVLVNWYTGTDSSNFVRWYISVIQKMKSQWIAS